MVFQDKDKIAIFDKIEKQYFHKNFGSMSKSDFETLLFAEYIECCIKNGAKFDDYTLSKELGITQSRIRSLKERKELKYPHNTDATWWRKYLVEDVKNAKYDEQDHYVKFIIQDVNVMSEVRHYIETVGWYDEASLNRKLLRIPLDCFTELFVEKESMSNLFTSEVKKTIQKISKDHPKESSIEKFVKEFNRDGLQAFLMSATKEAIGLVIDSLPFGGIAKIAFGYLGNTIRRM